MRGTFSSDMLGDDMRVAREVNVNVLSRKMDEVRRGICYFD